MWRSLILKCASWTGSRQSARFEKQFPAPRFSPSQCMIRAAWCAEHSKLELAVSSGNLIYLENSSKLCGTLLMVGPTSRRESPRSYWMEFATAQQNPLQDLKTSPLHANSKLFASWQRERVIRKLLSR